jgi:hypothetical protein
MSSAPDDAKPEALDSAQGSAQGSVQGAEASYAERRLANIRRNEAELARLLGDVREERLLLATGAEGEQSRKRAREGALEARRRWGGAGEGGVAEEQGAPSSRRSARLKVAAERPAPAREPASRREAAEERAEAEAEAAAVARPDASAIRERLSALLQASVPGPAGEDEWRSRAVKCWGDKVLLSGASDWRKYVQSRQVTPAPFGVVSPLALLQERYAEDPWRLLISCCLMSRVSSAQVKETCIASFFSRWPTPSAVIDAPSREVESVLAPLGLFLNRYRSVMELSAAYLKMPVFEIDLQEHKIYGFGEFAIDSYLIFCRGFAAEMTPSDKSLRAYSSWAKAQKLTL